MKKMICLLAGLALIATALCVSAFATDTTTMSTWDGTIPEANTAYVFEGSGTKSDPWLIKSAADLAQLAANVRLDSKDTTYGGKYFKLTCDIDLANHPWMGIGGGKVGTSDGLGTDGVTGLTYFAGNFEGDYHKIYNLKLASTGTVKNAETGADETYPVHQQGLFGYIMGARITNLGIESGSSVLEGGNRVGAFVGVGRCGFLIENCYNKSDLTVTINDIKLACVGTFGGQMIDKWDIKGNTEKLTSGVCKDKKFINCYNTGNLTVTLGQTDTANEFRIGGFTGQYVGGAPELDTVYSMGNITVVSNSVSSTKTNHCIGGITGALLDSAYTVNTYYKGKITFTANVANSETDMAKYQVGFLFGRVASALTYDSEGGINVGYLITEGSTATVAIASYSEQKTWYGAMTEIVLPLAENSTFIDAPEAPEPVVTTGEQTTEKPTTEKPTSEKPTAEKPTEAKTAEKKNPQTNEETKDKTEVTTENGGSTGKGCSSTLGLASVALIGLTSLAVGLIAGKKKHD